MVRGKGHGKQDILPLSESEKEDLLMQRREAEDQIKNAKHVGVGTAAEQIDVGKYQREIDKIDREISQRDVHTTGRQRDELAKELTQLEEDLMKNLPTRAEMDFPSKYPGAVRKHLRWVSNNMKNVERWRHCQRTLNPEDPKSIEQLRRKE